jgi:hypothetical protein
MPREFGGRAFNAVFRDNEAIAIRTGKYLLGDFHSWTSRTFSGAHGTLSLLSDIDPPTQTIDRTMRLEASADSRSVLLVASVTHYGARPLV